MEKRIALSCGGTSLESLLDERPGERGVVITHPHPLYGGDMHNNVVAAITEAYAASGFSTLRFNFRGVGASSGGYDGGVGERDDVQAALEKLHHLGKSELHLVGYSFGAWVVACGLGSYELAQCVALVAPPVSMLNFAQVQQNSKIRLIIVGSEDALADADTIRHQTRLWNPAARLHAVPGADHFFWEHTATLRTFLSEFLETDCWR